MIVGSKRYVFEIELQSMTHLLSDLTTFPLQGTVVVTPF